MGREFEEIVSKATIHKTGNMALIQALRCSYLWKHTKKRLHDVKLSHLFCSFISTFAFPALMSQSAFPFLCDTITAPLTMLCFSLSEKACRTSVSCFINVRHSISASSPTHERPNTLKQMREVAVQNEFISHYSFNGSCVLATAFPRQLCTAALQTESWSLNRVRCGEAMPQQCATKARSTCC